MGVEGTINWAEGRERYPLMRKVPEPESALGVVIRVFRANVTTFNGEKNMFDNGRGKHESQAYCISEIYLQIYQADVQPLKSHKAKCERGETVES